jgi:alpha-ketoglutarate-dependent taurine dioxygenase
MPQVLTRKFLADSIEQVQIGDNLADDLAQIRVVLENHFGAVVNGSNLTPTADPDGLRAALFEASPRLKDTVHELRSIFDGGTSVMIVPQVHLAHLDVDDRGLMLYCLALGLGYPTGTEPRHRQVVWPVIARAKPGEGFATHSELDTEAKYHTDTTFYPNPERYFILYSVRAARCGGGVSKLRASKHIINYLQKTDEGKRALQVLRALRVPFRIPSVFTDSGDASEKVYTFSRILDDQDKVRWRDDTVKRGLTEQPSFAHPDINRSIEEFEKALDEAPEEVRLTLDDDSLMLVDNHRALHARTAFQDRVRHLLRIRFHDRPPMQDAR